MVPSDLDRRARQNNLILRNAQSAIGIAGSPNPIVAMIDMVVMVSLQREALRREAIDLDPAFDAADRDRVVHPVETAQKRRFTAA